MSKLFLFTILFLLFLIGVIAIIFSEDIDRVLFNDNENQENIQIINNDNLVEQDNNVNNGINSGSENSSDIGVDEVFQDSDVNPPPLP